MAHKIRNAQTLQAKSKTHNITYIAERNNVDHFTIESGSSGSLYRVTINNNMEAPHYGCTCRWSEFQPQGMSVACSHVQKVVSYVASETGYKVKVRLTTDDTTHLHRKEFPIGDTNVKVTLRRD